MSASQSQPVWNEEHQKYLHTHWSPEHGRYFRNHYVEGRWVLFDWLPVQEQAPRADSPHDARAGPAFYPAIEGPEIRGTFDFSQPTSSSYVEPLDSSYSVRDSSFFATGQVFSILFTEPAGSTATNYNDSISLVRYGEYVHSQIRRFIVVSERRGFCYAIPIFTYGGQATKKRGVNPNAHAIAFSYGFTPSLLEGESQLVKDPICIVMNEGVPPLSAASRVFFGIHHPIQHNIKAKHIGRVHPDHLRKVLGYWNTQTHSPD